MFNSDAPIVRIIEPLWKPQTSREILSRLGKDFFNHGSKYFLNLPAGIISSTGELLNSFGEHASHAIAHVEGASDTLGFFGHPINLGLDEAKNFVLNVLKANLSEKQYRSLNQYYKELPHGSKIAIELSSDGIILSNAGKILSISTETAVGNLSKFSLKKLPAIESSEQILQKTSISQVKPKISLDIAEHSINKLQSLKTTEIIKTDFTSVRLSSHPEIQEFIKTHNWHELSEIIDLLPEGYKYKGLADGGRTDGLVFKDGAHNEIALKKAKTLSDYPSQQVDYFSYIQHGNQYVDIDGNIILKKNGIMVKKDIKTNKITILDKDMLDKFGITSPERHPDAHIPMTKAREVFNKYLKYSGDKK